MCAAAIGEVLASIDPAQAHKPLKAVLRPLVAAVSGGAANLFGHTGAVAADLMTQTFGWTGWLGGFALMAGGLRRAFGIGQRRASRCSCWSSMAC